ncbi:MAG: DUF5666 domain-containing protein [Pseudomonadota bacterium]
MKPRALLPLVLALGIGPVWGNPCAYIPDTPGLRLEAWQALGGIGGTGHDADGSGMGGTGVQADGGMGGTGVQADGGMGGTGKQAGSGMGGTGKQADGGMGGTGKQADGGMGGTGKQADGGMGGTGKQAGSGMGGTGKQAGSGMGGTGKQADGGMGGTGKQADGGMGGTGKQADGGMGGTGKQAGSGMGGTGKQADGGMGGTGKQAGSGMGGTGKQAGSGMGGTGKQADGGMGGTGVVGIITGFGSICVGGVELHYDGDTPVQIDGRPGKVEQLAVGQIVGVEALGHGESMQAVHINVQHAVTGPVSWVSSSGETMVVLGQVVKASKSDTAGLPPGQGIQVGDPVRISGLRGADGSIQATRVDPGHPADPLTVTGVVEGQAGKSLVIGGLAVQTDEPVAPGTSVQITGALEKGVMKAEQVKVDPELSFSKGVDRVLLQGVVRDSGDGRSLSLGYARVQAPVDKLGEAGVRAGQVVRVEAVRRPDGALDAKRLDVTPPPRLGDVPAGIPRVAPGKGTPGRVSGGARGSKPDRSGRSEARGQQEEGDKPHKQRLLEARDKPEHHKPETEAPEVEKPETEAPEVEKPEVEKPEVEKPEVEKPEVEKPEVEKPEVEKPEVEKPEVEKPEVEKPEVEKPEVEKPEVEKPEVEKPEVEKPEVEKPEVEKPEVEKPEVEKVEVEKVEVEKVEVEKVEVEKVEVEKVEVEKVEVEKVEVEKVEVEKVEVEKVEAEKPEREDRERVEKPEKDEKPEKRER